MTSRGELNRLVEDNGVSFRSNGRQPPVRSVPFWLREVAAAIARRRRTVVNHRVRKPCPVNHAERDGTDIVVSEFDERSASPRIPANSVCGERGVTAVGRIDFTVLPTVPCRRLQCAREVPSSCCSDRRILEALHAVGGLSSRDDQIFLRRC